MSKQKTIRNSISLSGIGLHSGKEVNLTLRPAAENTGIVFHRVDTDPKTSITLAPEKIQEALMCSTLVQKDIKIATIEHLMSALAGLSIDNIHIDIDAPEIPVMDGSAAPFVFLVQSAGIIEQSSNRKQIKILKPVRVELEDKYATFEPYDGYKLTFKIDFPHPVIKQTNDELDFVFSQGSFIKEICRARTFGFAKDLDKLHANNLALGASLNNAVGITDDGILNPEGLRFQDEFVRHKLLDAIGDLYVSGPIIGAYYGYKSGHQLNNMLLRALAEKPDAWQYI